MRQWASRKKPCTNKCLLFLFGSMIFVLLLGKRNVYEWLRALLSRYEDTYFLRFNRFFFSWQKMKRIYKRMLLHEAQCAVAYLLMIINNMHQNNTNIHLHHKFPYSSSIRIGLEVAPARTELQPCPWIHITIKSFSENFLHDVLWSILKHHFCHNDLCVSLCHAEHSCNTINWFQTFSHQSPFVTNNLLSAFTHLSII